MFNLQGSEIVIVLLLALVVLGPEKLPDAIRKVGQFYAEIKKMSSGFQSEFRAAVDEPIREMRDTANILRDSADFTKLQDGEREEKPKSAEMEPAPAPTDAPDVGLGPAADGGSGEPQLAADSKPSPFSGRSSAAPRGVPSDAAADDDGEPSEVAVDASGSGEFDGGSGEPQLAADSKPSPFSGRSSAAPRGVPSDAAADDDGEPSEVAVDASGSGEFDGGSGEPQLAADSKPSPFSGRSSTAPHRVTAPDEADEADPGLTTADVGERRAGGPADDETLVADQGDADDATGRAR